MSYLNLNGIQFDLISVSLATQFKFQISNLFNSNRELSRAITYSSFSVSVARCISNKISRVAFFFCLNLLLRLRVRMKTNETFPFARIPAFEAYAFDARQKGKFDEKFIPPL